MAELAVNIDHVATIREARGGVEPDPVTAAVIAELHGAVGIVCHLREDRRHINDRDVRMLREMVQTKLDLEMGATEEMIEIACEILPELVTIVPEKRQERTTEGGLDILSNKDYYRKLIDIMHSKEIEVSFFIEPEESQIDACIEIGADIIELHTGVYANARTPIEVKSSYDKIVVAANIAHSNGLRVTAGHGLTYVNIAPIIEIPSIVEVSIGHAIISRAVFVGLEKAVKDMIAIIRGHA